MANRLETMVQTKVRTDIGIGILLVCAVIATSFIVAFSAVPAFSSLGPQAVIQTSGFGRSGSVITMIAPATIVFSGASSAAGVERFEWNFGDASNPDYPQFQEGMIVGHRFENPDTTSLVTLTVYDKNGNKSSATVTVVTKSRPATAKTYYIDSVSGNNANDGLSPATAWRDIQKFYVPSSGTTRDQLLATAPFFYDTLPAGSQILFKRGQTYDLKGSWQMIRDDDVDPLPFDAATGNAHFERSYHSIMRDAPYYITIGAYGIGTRPVLMSSVAFDSNNMGLISMIDGSYAGANGKGIIIDGLEIRGSIWNRARISGNSTERPGMNVIVRNTKISGGQFINWGSDGFVFEQGEIDASGINAVALGSANDPHFSFISQSDIHGSITHCIYLAGSSQNSLIENNKIHDCGLSGRGGITAHGQQYNWDVRGNDIYNNDFAIGIDANVGYPDHLENIIIEKNRIYNNGDPAAGFTSGHTFQLSSIKNLLIKNNLIYANPGTSQPVFWFRGASVVQDMSNVQIYHNTIYSNARGILNIEPNACPITCSSVYLNSGGVCPAITATCNGTQDVHFKNNIVVGSNGSPIVSDRRSYAAADAKKFLDFSNNIYYNFSPTLNQFISPLGSFTLAAWLNSANDSGSYNADPLLNNPASGNFALQASSPAINRGAQFYVPYDYARALRSDGYPDIGAFEFIGSAIKSSPPPIITATTTATTTSVAAVAPKIITQPKSKSAKIGDNVVFSVVASGTAPLSYQWMKGGVNISGATAASLALNNVQLADAGYYSVKVSNSAGSKISNKVSLSVSGIKPSIIVQPVSQTVSAGSTVTFSVAAAGTAPLSYIWRKNGYRIAGATSASYTIANVSKGISGAKYSVSVLNSFGSVISKNATLTVK